MTLLEWHGVNDPKCGVGSYQCCRKNNTDIAQIGHIEILLRFFRPRINTFDSETALRLKFWRNYLSMRYVNSHDQSQRFEEAPSIIMTQTTPL